jgi:phosphomethylpyrimidine synthase
LTLARGRKLEDVSERSFYEGFELLSRYCDCIEIFPSLTKKALELLKKRRFLKWTISRAGNIILTYLLRSGKENPFYQDLNYFLDFAKKEEITLILGNGMRASCIGDSLDEAQMYEVEVHQEVAKEAIKRGVRIIAGVFGHVDPSKTEEMEKIREKLVIPIGGLGPLVTDVALGFDHINAAIGIVMMRKYIDWVSLITPSEHLGMPSLEDVEEGMTAVNIARHVLSLKEGREKERDLAMGRASVETNFCRGMVELAINPLSARLKRFLGHHEKNVKGCTLCGNWCPLINKKRAQLIDKRRTE